MPKSTQNKAAALIECHIDEQPLDILELRSSLPEMPDCGGYVAFEGHIRHTNHDKRVTQLDYQVYTALALKELRRIATEAAEEFDLGFVRCVHRAGTLGIGEPAVLIQVLARHRGEAFAGCQFLIDQLKSRVPIWKKEYYDDGSFDWTQCHEHRGLGADHGLDQGVMQSLEPPL